jgi:hypothetical protein
MATINAVNNGLSGATGTGSFVGSNSPTLVTPALGTPSSGDLSNCTNYPVSLPAGTQFNTQSFTLTSATTISSATFTSTGVTVNITPTSASNKVLVRAVVSVGMSTTNIGQFVLTRNGSSLVIGDAAGVRTQGTGSAYTDGNTGNSIVSIPFEYLDSPATTSATTYAVHVLTATPSPIGINQTITDSNSGTFPRCVSTITVCEVKV